MSKQWIVMSVTELEGKCQNTKRCFERNATGFKTKAEADIEAERRNAVEKEAGHVNVTWYSTKWEWY